jgi:hypothetical protein
MSLFGPQRRKTMSVRMSAIGGTSGLFVLTLSFVGHDPQRKSLPVRANKGAAARPALARGVSNH